MHNNAYIGLAYFTYKLAKSCFTLKPETVDDSTNPVCFTWSLASKYSRRLDVSRNKWAGCLYRYVARSSIPLAAYC